MGKRTRFYDLNKLKLSTFICVQREARHETDNFATAKSPNFATAKSPNFRLSLAWGSHFYSYRGSCVFLELLGRNEYLFRELNQMFFADSQQNVGFAV